MAKDMGISTDEKDIGDIYLLRKSSIFTNGGPKPNIKLGQYDFISEKIITAEEIKADPESGQTTILNLAFNSPVLVNNMQ